MKNVKRVFLLLAAAAVVVGGLALPAWAQEQRTDNFVLAVDQSSEMQVQYQGKTKHLLAREIARLFVNNVPKDLPLKGAVYLYGNMAAEDKKQIIRLQSFTAFNKNTFQKAVEGMGPKAGPPSLSVLLRELRGDMGNLQGRTSVIIITAGSIGDPGDAKAEAEKLADVHKNVCFYPILVGENSVGEAKMRSIEKSGASCGNFSNTSDVDSDKGMGRLVKQIFYK